MVAWTASPLRFLALVQCVLRPSLLGPVSAFGLSPCLKASSWVALCVPIAADPLGDEGRGGNIVNNGGEGRGGSVVKGVTCTDCSYEVAVKEEVVML